MKRWKWTAAAFGLMVAACGPAALVDSGPPTPRPDSVAAPAPPAEDVASTSAPDAPEAPAQETPVPTPLPDGPIAPELTHATWLNTEPLTSADLRGKLVLIDFWTFG